MELTSPCGKRDVCSGAIRTDGAERNSYEFAVRTQFYSHLTSYVVIPKSSIARSDLIRPMLLDGLYLKFMTVSKIVGIRRWTASVEPCSVLISIENVVFRSIAMFSEDKPIDPFASTPDQ